MGRGNNDNLLYGGPSRTSAPLKVKVPDIVATRDLDAPFNKNKEQWKKNEKAYISGVMSELKKATQEYAQSEAGWKEFLQIYSQGPLYTPTNNLWARWQLQHKGMENPQGMVMSESAWKALGRRVKEEYRKPSKKADAAFGYDPDRQWDKSLIVEMTRPAAFGYPQKRDANGQKMFDSQGKPIYDKDPKKGFPIGFSAFNAYHEDATESLDGSPAKPLQETAKWEGIEGDQQAAEKLLDDIEKEICFGNKINFVQQAVKDKGYGINQVSRQEVAKYDKESNTIIVDPQAPKQEQAAAALREVFVALNSQQQSKGSVENKSKRDQTAIASAQYVISSLYGLNTDKQTFPYLKELSQENQDLKEVNSRTHALIGKVVPLLDDRVKTHLRASKEYQKPNRAKRYKQQKSKTLA
jgi:hypothetical protein